MAFKNGRTDMGAHVHHQGLQLLCVMVVVSLGLLGMGVVAEAKIRTEEVDGVTWVHNPAQPEKGIQEITPTERWRIGGDDEDEIFGVVTGVLRTDTDEICILDIQLCELKFYSRDGEFLRSMGGQGEGPGEFLQGIGACLLQEGRIGVVQSFPGKVILFNADGTPGGEVIPRLTVEDSPQSYLAVFQAQRVGERVAIACMDQQFSQQGMKRKHLLGLFEQDGTLFATLTGSEDVLDMSQGYLWDEATMTKWPERMLGREDGALVIAKEFHDYRIEIFDSEGQPVMGITREYERLTRTPEERKMFEDLFGGFVRSIPSVRLSIEDDHKAVEELHWGPDGKLWVLTGEGRYRSPEGVFATYDVYDSYNGHFVKQVAIKVPGDATRDAMFPLGDQVLVVRGLLDSAVSMAGGAKDASEEAAGIDEEAAEEGVTIICYDL